MTVDLDVKRRVGEDRRGPLLAHQRGERFLFEGAAAQHAMAAEPPQIAEFADRQTCRGFRHNIGGIPILLGPLLQGCDPQIDLAHLKAGQFDTEIEPE
jgi:hypothetical protein